MHYYSFHIGDYMSHTRHLSLIEDLAYRRLLDFYYLHEQPIKQRDIARQIGMREHEQDVLTVLNEFFLSTEDGFINTRADKQIEDFKIHQAKSALGAFLRDNKSIAGFVDKDVFVAKFLEGSHKEYISTLCSDHVQTMGTSSTDDATNNQEPITINHKPKKERKSPAAPCPPDVDEKVWQDYLVIRKAKRLPVTETAIDDIRAEARVAGMTFDRAIRECVIRGWAGFKAKWLVEKMTAAEQKMNTMHQLTGGLTTPKISNFWDKPKLDVIEVEDVERKRLL
jgi:hypothetical protein